MASARPIRLSDAILATAPVISLTVTFDATAPAVAGSFVGTLAPCQWTETHVRLQGYLIPGAAASNELFEVRHGDVNRLSIVAIECGEGLYRILCCGTECRIPLLLLRPVREMEADGVAARHLLDARHARLA